MKLLKKLKNKKSASEKIMSNNNAVMTSQTPPSISETSEPITSHTVNETATTATDLSADTKTTDLSLENSSLDQQPQLEVNPEAATEKKAEPELTTVTLPIIETEKTTQTADTPNTTTQTDTPLSPDLTAIATLTEEKPTKPAKVKLTGRMLNFTRLNIEGNDLAQIQEKLSQKFANQPNNKMLVVLNCEEQLDLTELLQILWDFGLQPIGIITGKMDEQAREQKFAIFPADGKRIDVLAGDKKTDEKKIGKPTPSTLQKTNGNTKTETIPTIVASTSDTTTSQQVTPDSSETVNDSVKESASTYTSSLPQTSHLQGDLIYSSILRSGQSINHVGGDLVLTNGINAGAEAITDYSLHVYGKAEGRLVAGATGDENARIFCLRFNPSLVSVAGTFCLRENIPSEFLDKAVQVHHERDKGLVFTLING